MPYDHQSIEKKWQERWESSGAFRASEDPTREKFYCLIEFPYPSGAGLHLGHPRSYTALDIVARRKRMEGKNVLYPIGWDAFGLPTENYAIKTGRTPQEITKENTDTFRRQLKALGLSFDWSREINTTDPNYYRWTQWMFLEFFRAGLAYKTKTEINWCPACKIGLANEEAVGGVCDRCGGAVEKREKEQWMLAITKYADRLLADLNIVDYLPKIKTQQQNWIGRSEGINIRYDVVGLHDQVEVFTTRPDTNFGATFLALAPDGEFAKRHLQDFPERLSVEAYVKESAQKSEIDRVAEGRKKTGVFTGLYAVNQLTGKQMPIYVADFVLGNVGTGALVGVPGHDLRDFEFAQEKGIEIIRVVIGSDGDTSDITRPEQVQEESGTMVNSEFLDGLDIHAATKKVMDYIEEKGWGKRVVHYKLRDWVFSRQRYWGEPIPLVWCDKCPPVIASEAKQSSVQKIASSPSAPRNDEGKKGSWVPVPDDQLPVVLPEVERYQPTDTGESPLANIAEFVNTTCPSCGGPAKRETDTMPNWAGSSWYFLRYVDPYNDQAFASKEALKYWMPVDLYNGGMEHTVLHLLYSRFWNKFLFDRGHVPTSEPYTRRHSHGLILASDGSKMSKSKGNAVNPDDLVREYGADTLRLYEMFIGPFEEAIPWNPNGVVGARRFLEKAVAVTQKAGKTHDPLLIRSAQKCIKRVSEDIEAFKFNTAVAHLMKFVNETQEKQMVDFDAIASFLKLLAPFAPHIAEELWEKLGHTTSIFAESWPTYDPELARDEMVEVAIQVNGKLRGTMTIAPDLSESEVRELAAKIENVKKFLADKSVIKVIYVSGRLLNFVVK